LVAKKSLRKHETVTDIVDTTFVSLDENTLVAEGAKALYEQDSCSIIVTRYDAISHQRIPVGLITERDVIYRVVAQNKGPFKVTLKHIMSTPLITIDSDKLINDALAILKKNKINRLPVMNKGALIGLVTTEMILHKIPVGRQKHSET
jgi:CBS domain-containing protein